jgi:hypothetical protein
MSFDMIEGPSHELISGTKCLALNLQQAQILVGFWRVRDIHADLRERAAAWSIR